ncbi:MAG: hypothetical protein JWQ40_3394, partial [Segetibacter sp.]|nr:hypothetical protein [Segetibacter sp.]
MPGRSKPISDRFMHVCIHNWLFISF